MGEKERCSSFFWLVVLVEIAAIIAQEVPQSDQPQSDDSLLEMRGQLGNKLYARQGTKTSAGVKSSRRHTKTEEKRVFSGGTDTSFRKTSSRDTYSSHEGGGVKTQNSYDSAEQDGAQFKGGCHSRPVTPNNTKIQCAHNSGCLVMCLRGYQFPNSRSQLFLTCKEGEWEMEGTEWATIPNCEPICLPACQNNGICVAPNQCNCPDNYSGPQCQYEKKPCLNFPPIPLNSRRSCRKKSCTISCAEGHRFPDGSGVTNTICKDGIWVPTRPDWVSIPDCLPVCEPACENGGVCLSLDVCQCPQEFRGAQCQYLKDVCTPSKLNFNGGYSCTDSVDTFTCSVSCPNRMTFEQPPAAIYTCHYSTGVFTPTVPQCILMDSDVEMLPIGGLSQIISHSSNSSTSFSGSSVHQVNSSWSDFIDTWDEHSSSYGNNGVLGLLNLDNSLNQIVVNKRPVPGVCYTWNGDHYKTFDGEVISFQSDCTYNLVRDDVDNTFSINLENQEDHRKIIVFAQDKEYILTLTSHSIPVLQLGTRELPLPAQLSGVSVEFVAHYVVLVLTGLGVSVKWDGKEFVSVSVSESMWNRTTGLCGRIDGSEENDLTTKGGTIPKSCQTTPSEEHTCNTGPVGGSSVTDEANIFCDKLLTDLRFAACKLVLKPDLYYQACRWDYCACKDENRTSCACNSLAVYARECNRLGVHSVINWRDEETCPMRCTGGRVYSSCGTNSQETCGSGAEHAPSSDRCEEGCYCPSGTVLHEQQCIPKTQCPCQLRGKTFTPGYTIPKECNTCKCTDGQWVCTQVNCGSRCGAIGDPHYITFDGRRYNFMGKCSYYLLKGDNYSIETENIACAGAISESMGFSSVPSSNFPSCTKAVTVRLGDRFIKLRQNREVSVNGQEITQMPFTMDGATVRIASSIFLIGMTILGFMSTTGLCGTFNLNQKDDFLTPEDDIEQSVISFANKWKTQEVCEDSLEKVLSHPCDINNNNRATAEKYCSKIKSPLFQGCHWLVDPEPYYLDCLFDLCSCQNKIGQCLCPILAAYAKECAHEGLQIDFRNEINECAVQCTAGQKYQVCGNSCTRSCNDISHNPECRRQCVEGCNCPEGQTLDNNGECIPIEQCSCTHNSVDYPPGHKEVRPGIKGLNLCTCRNAAWDCRLATEEEIRTNPKSGSLNCSATNNEEFTICEPVEAVTCKNMHNPPLSTPAKCIPGCQCKKGTCEGGKWKCTDRVCAGVCTAWGDSHFKTFDDKIYDFHGSCDYVLAKGKLTKSDAFDVSIQNVPCSSSGISCSKSVTLNVGEGPNQESITFTKDKPVPNFSGLDRITVREAGLFVFAEVFDLGLLLQWDRGTRVYIKVDPRWIDKLKGLCGNYNNNELDDFQTPTGGISEVSPKLFGDSWRLQPYCQETLEIEDTCDIHPTRKVWALQKCGIMKSSLFQPCHSEVPLEPYLNRCIFDSCACDMGAIQCDEKCSQYSPCVQTCPKETCDNHLIYKSLTPLCKEDFCVEGCEVKLCPPGQVYNNLTSFECVPQEKCKTTCLQVGNITYNEGDVMEQDACHTCHCSHGRKLCKGQPCPPLTTLVPGTEPNERPYQCYNMKSEGVCSPNQMTSIKCRIVGSHETHKESGENVICDIQSNGLQCKGLCHDYEIKVYCQCETTSTTQTHLKPNITTTLGSTTPHVTTTTRAPTTAHAITTTMVPLPPPERCDPNKINIPHPSDCYIFYQCQDLDHGTQLVEKMCGPHTMFNPVTMTCDWPSNVVLIRPDCTPVSSTTTTTTTTTITPVTTSEQPSCIDGWSEWLNTTANIQGDLEVLSEYIDRGLLHCPLGAIRDIQCKFNKLVSRSIKEEGLKGKTRSVTEFILEDSVNSGDNVMCDASTGLLCYNSQQSDNSCKDYAIKVLCDCECEDDEVWSDCAVSCTQMCQYYDYEIRQQGRCLNGQECISGCLPVGEEFRCLADSLWRDRVSCVRARDCTCVSHSGISVKPGVLYRESDCEFCQCVNNRYICDDSACFTTRPGETPSVPTTPPVTIYETTPWRKTQPTTYETKTVPTTSTRIPLNASTTRVPSSSETSLLSSTLTSPGVVIVTHTAETVYTMGGGYQQKISTTTPESSMSWTNVELPSTVWNEPSSTTEYITPFTIVSTTTPPALCEKNNLIHLIEGPKPLPSSSLSASSSLDQLFTPDNALLSAAVSPTTGGSWTAGDVNKDQYLQVDLGRVEPVYGVLVKGSPIANEYVTSYKVLYSLDGHTYSYVFDKDNMPATFRGPTNNRQLIQQVFHEPVEARYIRFNPVTWHSAISMKVELIGCSSAGEEGYTTTNAATTHRLSTTPVIVTVRPTAVVITTTMPAVCVDNMGLEDGMLRDEQISVSSVLNDDRIKYGPSRARLNSEEEEGLGKGWIPSSNSYDEWIQFDFLEPRNLTGVTTQGGNHGNSWVEAYTVKYSHDGKVWNPIVDTTGKERVFLANFDSDTPHTNHFEHIVQTRLIRLVPVKWHHDISLRAEVLGCYLPYLKTTLPTTTPETPTEKTSPLPSTCQPCPTLPRELLDEDQCDCPEGERWDGEGCTSLARCPCFVGLIPYAVGTTFLSEDCHECQCNLRGVVKCDEKPLCGKCDQGLQSVLTPSCGCTCKPCPAETLLCATSNICINASSWCDGVEDCPDDERNCPTTSSVTLSTHVPTTYTTGVTPSSSGLPSREHWSTLSSGGVTTSSPELTHPTGGITPSSPELTQPTSGITSPPELTQPTGGITSSPELTHSTGGITPSSPELTRPTGGLTPTSPELTHSTGGITPSSPELTRPTSGITPSSPELTSPTGGVTPSSAGQTLSTHGLTPYTPGVTPSSAGLTPSSPELTSPTESVTTLSPERTLSTHPLPPGMKPTIATTTTPFPTVPPTCPTPSCPPGYEPRMISGNKYANLETMEETKTYKYSGVKKGATKTRSRGTKTSKGGRGSTDRKLPKPQKFVSNECPKYECNFKPEEVPPTSCPPPHCPDEYTVMELEGVKVSYGRNACPRYKCVPPPPPPAVCNITGRTFNTFDGTEYKYDACHHLLARDRDDGLWEIAIKKNCSLLVSCNKYLLVTQDSTTVELHPDLSLGFEGNHYSVSQIQRISSEYEDFSVSKLGDSLYFESHRYGFWARIDSQGNAKIGVDGKLSGHVDGLCGFFNGRAGDDKQKPDGSNARTSVNFGNSWGSSQMPEVCEAVTCPVHIQNKALEMCSKVREKPLSQCASSVNVERFLSHCIETTCACLESNGTQEECRCQALLNFVTECQATNQDIDLSSWRMQLDCPVSCPGNLVFNECYKHQCERSCDNLMAEDPCPVAPNICFPGCFCPEGLVRKGELCVKPVECRDCICDGFGDPQYLSFDRSNFTFNGNCTYIAARDISPIGEHDFQVLVKNTHCRHEPTSTCTEAVTVIHEGHTIHIRRNHNTTKLQTLLDGINVDEYPLVSDWLRLDGSPDKKLTVLVPKIQLEVSYFYDNFAFVIRVPSHFDWLRLDGSPDKKLTVLVPKIQLEVSYFYDNFAFVIRVPSHLYGGKTEGLCGNCNYDQTDDFRTHGGQLTNDTDKFGMSWLEPKLSKHETCVPILPLECVPLPPDEDPCIKLLDSERFGKCHPLVDIDPYLQSCQFDVCNSPNKMAAACRVLEAYARECLRADVCLDWRSKHVCPYKCQPGYEYQACGLGCTETCENYEAYRSDPSSCELSQSDGCYCPNGQVLKNGICVDVSRCKPCDNDGHFSGDTWHPDSCTTCTCSGTLLRCEKTSCPPKDRICDQSLTPVVVPGTDKLCCPEYMCVYLATPSPSPGGCPEVQKPNCGADQDMKLQTDSDGCPFFVCCE
uniref:Hemocytin n=1 Tax=Timema cristinae TaxID=61476 RepID=A0A7R9CJT7_TIMCR|nr:unnamed protein product [Timema cristinae]